MPKSEFLGLEITTDENTRFRDWSKSINGEIDSNALIIDSFAKDISDSLSNINQTKADKTELNDYVTASAFDIQMLEKLGIKPNGTDLLIIDGMINPLYVDDTSYKAGHEIVTSQSEMLSLQDVIVGTVVMRTDLNNSLFILTALPASVLANWQVASPNTVLSVAGRTGAVVLGISDIDNLSGTLNLKLDITTFETQLTQLQEAITNKVDMISGKGLSTEDYTTNEKNKLDGIEAGAEVNVQSDWNITDTTNDGFIKNKPKTVAATSEMTEKVGLNENNELVVKPSGNGGGGIEEAPIDNRLYGRKNETWQEIEYDFASLPNQAAPLLTDVMVLNRGATAQKTTLGALLALVNDGTNSLVDALCWRGTCEAVPAAAATDALTWR